MGSKRDREPSLSPSDQPPAKQKLSDTEYSDDTPTWAIKEFSTLRNFLEQLDSKIQRKYDSISNSLESIETRLSQATTDATAAVKTARDCKSIVAECVSDVGALQSNYSDFVNIMNEKCEKLELQCKQHKEQILLQETYSRKKT